MTVKELGRQVTFADVFREIEVSDTPNLLVGSPCWLWKGRHLKKRGKITYGYVVLDKKTWLVHQLLYLRFRRYIPPGWQLDHLCRVTLCCNPAHLEPVTGSVNVLRGELPEITRQKHASITHCPKGHSYAEYGTLLKPNRKGHVKRRCSECHRLQERERGRAFRAANPLPERTHCKAGHPYAEFGVRYGANQDLYCKVCDRLKTRRLRAAKKGT